MSWGEINAVAPGQAQVRVESGSASAVVSVEVRAGVRHRMSDAEWDAEFGGGCSAAGPHASSSAAEKSGVDAILPDPDSGSEGLARQALSPENEVGAPRFGAVESARASATKTRSNHGSANYSFFAPVLSLVGRESSIKLGLAYNSRVWEKDQDGGVTTMRFNWPKGWPAAGWHLGFGRINENYDGQGNHLLIAPDGTRTRLEQDSVDVNEFRSTDGTFLKYNALNGKLKYPDGTIVTYELSNATNQRRLPTSIQSPNGNMLVVGYRPYNGKGSRWAINSITDTLRRVTTFVYAGANDLNAPEGALIEVLGPGYNGAPTRSLVKLQYRAIALNYNFTTAVESPGQGATITVLRRIYYPATGRGYLFDNGTNEATDPAYSSYGMIRRISLRAGMTDSGDGTEVGYTKYNYPKDQTESGSVSDMPRYTQRSEYWSGKTDDAGQATTAATVFSHSKSSVGTTKVYTVDHCDTSTPPAEWLSVATTVDDDSASDTYGKTVSVEHFRKTSSSSTSLQRTHCTYATPPSGGQSWADGGLQIKTVTTTRDTGANASSTRVTFAYGNNFARVTSRTESDFGSGTTYTTIRTTEYDYLTTQGADDYTATNGQTGNFLYLVKEVRVRDASSTVVAKTTMAYDGGALVSYSGMDPNDPTRNTTYDSPTKKIRSNVTSVTQWLDPTATVASASNSITRGTTYDVYGNVKQAEVSCCMVKNFDYSSVTHYAFPDAQVDGTEGTAPWLRTEFTYDFNTSLVRTVKDPQGNTATYSYDPSSLRPTTVTRPSLDVTTVNTVTSVMTYDDEAANPSVASRLEFYDDGVLRQITSKTWFDGAGRAVRAATRDEVAASDWDAVKAVYDSQGRLLKQSNPYSTPSQIADGSPTAWTTFAYDQLSRVRTATLPDGQTRTTDYPNGKAVKSLDEAGRWREAVVDALGRLATVKEQDPAASVSASPSWTTEYFYDALDNLTEVRQYQPGTSNYQQRRYAYDALSRLIYERVPEQTPSAALIYQGVNWTAKYEYTDFGAVDKRTDARGVVTDYGYDTLNRLVTVAYATAGTTAAATPTVTITYNNKTAAPWKGNGQVQSIADSGTGSAGTESFEYDDYGRVTSRSYATAGSGPSWTTGYQYNSVGQVVNLIYPSGRKVHQTRDGFGRLRGLERTDLGQAATYLSNVTYTPAGQVQGLTLGNGVAESYAYSADRLQLTSQTAVKGASTLVSLAYDYTANAGGDLGTNTAVGRNVGQLVGITGTVNGETADQTFKYDLLGRLSAATGNQLAGGCTTAPLASSVTAAADSSSQITVSWTNASQDPNRPTSYELQRSTDGGSTWSTPPVVLPATTLTYTDTNLSASTTYTYRVRAVNSCGYSEGTASATTQPPPCGPSAPTGATATANTSRLVTVGWTDASSNETGFVVERKGDARGTANVGIYDPAAGTFSLKYSNSGGPADATFAFGAAGLGWLPLVGDWNANGEDTVGVYDPSTGVFYLRNTNTAGPADVQFVYGAAGLGWVPIIGDWNGDGTDSVGLYDPSTGVFYLRDSNSDGAADYRDLSAIVPDERMLKRVA